MDEDVFQKEKIRANNEVWTNKDANVESKAWANKDDDVKSKAWTNKDDDAKSKAWTKEGFLEAVKLLLAERNTLFESLSEKLNSYPELDSLLRSLLFMGKTISYNYYEPSIQIATMFGFVKENKNVLAVSNRIFETWLYNYYLSATYY